MKLAYSRARNWQYLRRDLPATKPVATEFVSAVFHISTIIITEIYAAENTCEYRGMYLIHE